jgi:hypothetical protein
MLSDALLTDDDRPQDWKVRVSVYGVAGLLLVPVFSHTPAAQVNSRKRARDESTTATAAAQQYRAPRPTVSNATHDCIWDTYVQIPIRWRDLPRDAYLLFEVMGQADTVVSLVALAVASVCWVGLVCGSSLRTLLTRVTLFDAVDI